MNALATLALALGDAVAALALAEAVPHTERLIAQTENALAVLLGRNPEAVPRAGRSVNSPSGASDGISSPLPERRPDIVAQGMGALVPQDGTWPPHTETGHPRANCSIFLKTWTRHRWHLSCKSPGRLGWPTRPKLGHEESRGH